MYQEEETFLPHTLSLQGASHKPVGGLTEAIFDEASSSQRQHLPLDRLLTLLMSSPDSAVLARRLGNNPDEWPLPQALQWQAWDPERGLPELQPEDRRLLQIFEQIVFDHRKSSKYESAFAELQARYPDTELFSHLLASYRFSWHPLETSRQFAEQELSRHPGWLLVRLQLARSYLKEDQLDLEAFATVMNHRLNMHEHLENLESHLNDLLVYQFHIDLFLFFALKGNLRRAAFCFNQAHKASSQPEGLVALAPLLLASLDPESGVQAFRELVRFLKT